MGFNSGFKGLKRKPEVPVEKEGNKEEEKEWRGKENGEIKMQIY